MSAIDWDKVKFRASSWGNLLAESKTKGELVGKTAAAELVKIYNRLKYGRKKDITTTAMDKGKQLQADGIRLFSMMEGELYRENNDQLESEWFCGMPDMYSGESITKAIQLWDLKNSFELDTFTPKLIDGIDKSHEAQINVYFDLCNCDEGGIVHTLLSAPENILMAEKRKLLYNMNVISEESKEYLDACAELEKLLTFEDIPHEERIIKFPVKRNDELIQKMKDKVPIFREWLFNLERKHLSIYPKDVTLEV